MTIAVSASGTPPLSYQWLKNGAALAAGSSPLSLPNVTRTNSGTYAVIVTNLAGNMTSSNVVLKVLVPQYLGTPVLRPDGTLQLNSGDADGGLLTPSDLANFEAQVSTNLTGWVTLPGALSLTNGMLRLEDPGSTNVPMRFYRIIEH